MDAGTYLLWLSALTGLGSVAFSALFLRSSTPLFRRLARALLMASVFFATATFLLLVYAFQVSDFTIDYVLRHSSATYDPYYKLAGVWSGDKGSFLLWTWFIALSLGIEEALLWRRHRKQGGPAAREVYDWIRPIAAIVYIAMLVMLLQLNLFAKTNPALLASPAGETGFGLNALLETPMVIIHPPMEFAGYALVTLPFAAALAFLITGDRTWVETSLQWGRVAWVTYTAAIVLGGIWAYTVLGWGGYWAWDPVETVNLIAWIALTAFVHAQVRLRQRRAFVWVAPALAVLAFVLTLFATFETRTGYVESVHSFTSLGVNVAPPATAKLLLVTGEQASGPFLLGTMLVSLFVAAALFLWRFHGIRRAEAGGTAPLHLWIPRAYIPLLAVFTAWTLLDMEGFLRTMFDLGARLTGGNADLGTLILALGFVGVPVVWVLLTGPDAAAASRPKEVVNDTSSMAVAVAIFSLWFLVTFALLILGVNGVDREVFESRLPLLVIPLGMVLVAALIWRELGTERLLLLLGTLTILSVAFHFLLEPGRFWVYVPVAATGIAVSIHGIWKSVDLKRAPKEFRIAGTLLVGSGLLGMLMWGTMPSRVDLGPIGFDVSAPLALLGFAVSLAALTGATFAVRAQNVRASAVTALMGIAALGYAVGAVLAGVALAALLRRKREPEGVPARRLKEARPALHRAAAHLIHLGVTTLLLAYAASTFLASQTIVEASPAAPSPTSTGLSFQLTQVLPVDGDGDGRYERITCRVEVYRDGRLAGEGDLVFAWTQPAGGGSPTYTAGVDVTVLPMEDLYFIPLAFRVADGNWTEVREAAEMMRLGTNIDRVAFEFRVNPLVGVLWAGVWMMIGGMVVRVAIDQGRPRLGRKATVPVPARVVPRTPTYEDRLEEELRGRGGGT